MKIRKLADPASGNLIALLLLADPSEDIVKKYLLNGTCYVAFVNDRLTGAYILLPLDEETVELINIVIAEEMQGKGLGKQLLSDAIRQAKAEGFKKLVLGTGNSSVKQLAMYKGAGFTVSGVDRGFFTRNYKDPIIENGILCADMIRLELIL